MTGIHKYCKLLQLGVHWWPTPWSLFDWVQSESWPSVVFITLALSLLRVTVPNIWPSVTWHCPTKIYTPESQLPIILNVSLPPGLILGHPRSSYAWVPASHHPQHKPSPWTLPQAEADVMSLVLVLSPTLSTQDPYTDLWVWTQCYSNNGPIQTTVTWSLPAGWSQSSLTRWQSPPIITYVGVSFNWHHTWVMWKITGGFRVVAPFTPPFLKYNCRYFYQDNWTRIFLKFSKFSSILWWHIHGIIL